MDKKIIKFDETEIEKCEFYQHESPNLIGNRDNNKIVVSNEASFGKNDFKIFIGYKDAKRIRLLGIFFPKISTYRRDFDKTKCMYFLTKKKLLEK